MHAGSQYAGAWEDDSGEDELTVIFAPESKDIGDAR